MGEIVPCSALSNSFCCWVREWGDMQRPERFNASPRSERGISHGTWKLKSIFRSLDPFLEPWRLLATVGCCCQTEYQEMGTRSQGSHGRDRMHKKGLNNAEPCCCVMVVDKKLPSNSAFNRFWGTQNVKTPERCFCLGLRQKGCFQD